MSDYDRRYNVHVGHVSYYRDTAEEVLAIVDKHPEGEVWVAEGYADYRDVFNGMEFMGMEITRRTTGPVLISSLRFKVQRRRVQEMLKRMREVTA